VIVNRGSALPRDGSQRSTHSPEELRRACQQFEEIFLRMVLKEAHIDRSLFNDKGASNLYGDLMRETLAKAMAQGGGFGVADMLYRQLSKGDEPTAAAMSPDKLNSLIEIEPQAHHSKFPNE